MGISERREREKIERRKAILKCAKELILTRGVEHVSMEDIASQAELSKATVYLYFSGKEVLLSEICEDAARVFLQRLKPSWKTHLTGIEALKYFWQGYMELFGNSDDMVIVFQVRNFLNSWLTVVSLEETNRSSHVRTIIEAVETIIDQCKAEGLFVPELDSGMATRLLLSMFSVVVEKAARVPPEVRKSPAVMEEMTFSFQTILRGFAREGIDLSCLDITGVSLHTG